MGITVSSSVMIGSLRLGIVNIDPPGSPGAGQAVIYVIDNEDGTATLRIKAGMSTTPQDLAVDFGGGVYVA